MNVLMTLNIGGFLCPNARNSMLAASERWDCLFHEITMNLAGDQYIAFNKVFGIREFCKTHDIETVFYLDADCLIRSDTPNPFELFTDSGVYGVRDAYEHWSPTELESYQKDITDEWLKKVHQAMKWDVDIDDMIRTCPSWFFNTGMFILKPRGFADEIESFVSSTPLVSPDSLSEQALWNYILHPRNKVILIDGHNWNYIDSSLSTQKMEYYIYHFTGMTNRGKLRTNLPTYPWKV